MNRYFKFLCKLVDEDESGEYDMLLGELHWMKFYSLIPNDDNRAEDGKRLREIFIDEEGQHALSQSQLIEPCSVLEMLIGLSFRLEFETAQSRWEKTPSEWFWILLDNLGLSWCDNSMYLQLKTTDDILVDLVDIVKNFLDRHYKSDGSGGLFPLKNPKKDQRRVEIWYQMSAYILENYPI